MQGIREVIGLVAPIDRVNVDTDAIIPKQFLKSIRRSGFGVNLFDAWRYLDVGEPGKACDDRPKNPDFVLNQVRYQGANILLTRANFGCGSSREHAPWALKDFGIQALIGTSFADIFFNNCFKNGIIPIVLPEPQIDHLFNECRDQSGFKLDIQIENQQIICPNGTIINFEIDAFRKQCLLNGWDDIGLTLRFSDEIQAYEQQRRHKHPYYYLDDTRALSLAEGEK